MAADLLEPPPEQHWEAMTSLECAPSHLLPVKNTFIDWPSAEPPPLELEKHVSCPAAFELGRDISCGEICTQTQSLWRLNGISLEVNLDGLDCVVDARRRAAAVLEVSMDQVHLVGPHGVAVHDSMAVADLNAEELQLVVSSDAEARLHEVTQNIAHLVDAICVDKSNVDAVAQMEINSHEELTLAISLIVRHSISDRVRAESCAELLLALKKRSPACPATGSEDDGTQVSFARVLLSVCQSEHEAALESIAMSQERGQRCILLFSFFGLIFTRGLLPLKVVKEIMNDLLLECHVVPAPLAVECACHLLQSVCPMLASTNTGRAFLSRLGLRVTEMQSDVRITELPDSLPLQFNLQQILNLVTSSHSMPRAVL